MHELDSNPGHHGEGVTHYGVIRSRPVRDDTRPAFDPTPAAGAEQQRLDVIAGTWRVDGENHDPIAPMTGEDSYDWLPGGFFLINRWDRRIGDTQHTGLGVFGYDAASRSYRNNAFDNLGYVRMYRLVIAGRTWTFTGPREQATYRFSEGGSTIAVQWQRSRDGTVWTPLCDITLTRIG
jgi:uncharacterized protein DUF1579